MDFSIIIPALNEGHKIAVDVRAAAEFIVNHFKSGQVIVVSDGSTDNTAEKARVPLPAAVQLKVLSYEINRGKGYAVRRGILESTGTYVMFADSGLCVPYNNALRGLALLQQGCHLAHGSRKRKDSIVVRKHRTSRQMTSKLFLLFLKIGLQLPRHITDTQCGFKMYNGDIARELYAELVSDGFLFDLETILRAKKKNYRICEFPVEWTADTDTRLELARMPTHILSSLLHMRKEMAKTKPKTANEKS
ncbi:glycosyltransferase [candidate division KSB1 bacterium]|nr:glycosyltransferase [candidate division KSB1 bacterium]